MILLVGVLGYGFLEASAKAKIANLVTNLSAIAVFAANGSILWALGLMMGAANLVGGLLGARTAISRGNAFVRKVFLVVLAGSGAAAGLRPGPPARRLARAARPDRERRAPAAGQVDGGREVGQGPLPLGIAGAGQPDPGERLQSDQHGADRAGSRVGPSRTSTEGRYAGSGTGTSAAAPAQPADQPVAADPVLPQLVDRPVVRLLATGIRPIASW